MLICSFISFYGMKNLLQIIQMSTTKLSRAELEKLTKSELIEKLLSTSNGEKDRYMAKKLKKLAKSRDFDFDKFQYRKIALKISYQGMGYNGFTYQNEMPNLTHQNLHEIELGELFRDINGTITKTVEGELFKAMMKCKLIRDIESSNLSRAGRTDAGVSGVGQVISLIVRSHFSKEELEEDPLRISVPILKEDPKSSNKPAVDINNGISSDLNIRAEKIDKEKAVKFEMAYVDMINRNLPNDIRVVAWSPVKLDFDARFNCIRRRYKYFFTNDPSNPLNIELMREACQLLVGEHDFRYICRWQSCNKITNFKRTIHKAEINLINLIPNMGPPSQLENVVIDKGLVQFFELDVEANAFLLNQIRCIMGLLFLIGLKHEPLSIISTLLNYQDLEGKPSFEIASPEPLIFYDTQYKMDYQFQWLYSYYVKKQVPFSKTMDSFFESWYKDATKLFLQTTMFNSISSNQLNWSPQPPNVFFTDPSTVLFKGYGERFYVKGYISFLKKPLSEDLDSFNKKHEVRHNKVRKIEN